MKRLSFVFALLLAFGPVAGAKVTLPSLLGDGMVLQRNTRVMIWGSTDRTSTVQVETSWDGRKYSTRPEKSGNWSVLVDTPDAGGPYSISISDGEKLRLDNVLIGEVWICSGQSNMEMPVGGWDHQRVEGALQTIRVFQLSVL